MKWNKKEQRPKDGEIILTGYSGKQYRYNERTDTVTDLSDKYETYLLVWDKVVSQWVSYIELISTIEEE